jgi:hypothetical protein
MKRWSLLILLVIFGCSGPSEKSGPTTVQIPTKRADDTAAVRVLTEVNTAQADYLRRNRRYALTFDELVESHLLSADPAKSAGGYEINLHPAADAESYTLVAAPISPSGSSRFFFSDKTGVIRAEQGKEATASSAPIS